MHVGGAPPPGNHLIVVTCLVSLHLAGLRPIFAYTEYVTQKLLDMCLLMSGKEAVNLILK